MRRVLYRLPELLAADPMHVAFVVEGEKDVDNLHKLGLIAITNVGGAGKWRPEYNKSLRGRSVVVLPDNEGPGRNHALDIARNLHNVAASVKIIELPNLPIRRLAGELGMAWNLLQAQLKAIGYKRVRPAVQGC